MTSGLSRTALRRIVSGVVTAEVGRLHGGSAQRLPKGDWPDDMLIGEGGLDLDSLEYLGALGALADMFDGAEATLGSAAPRTMGDWIDWVGPATARPDASLSVATSGSTGTPRRTSHPIARLQAEAEFFASQLSDRRRVLALVPGHHLYGLIWTALLPAALGAPVLPRELGTDLGLQAGDLIVAVPDQWKVLLQLNRTFPDGVSGASSGGQLPDELGPALRAAGLSRLVDIYGASETGAIGMREAPSAPFDLMPRWHFEFIEGTLELVDQQGRHEPLPDHIERVGPRAFRPIGRRDGAVQVGGLNVWPAQVAATLRTCPGVAEVAVRLDTNGRLKAFVVPEPSWTGDALQDVLVRFAADHLAVQERPKRFDFGPALPRNEMGKLQDWN